MHKIRSASLAEESKLFKIGSSMLDNQSQDTRLKAVPTIFLVVLLSWSSVTHLSCSNSAKEKF